MLAQARHPLEVIARETGFVDLKRMRRAFCPGIGNVTAGPQEGVEATNFCQWLTGVWKSCPKNGHALVDQPITAAFSNSVRTTAQSKKTALASDAVPTDGIV